MVYLVLEFDGSTDDVGDIVMGMAGEYGASATIHSTYIVLSGSIGAVHIAEAALAGAVMGGWLPAYTVSEGRVAP